MCAARRDILSPGCREMRPPSLKMNSPSRACITEMRPGAQIVVAYAGGENFGIFNLEAQTRYQVLSRTGCWPGLALSWKTALIRLACWFLKGWS